MAAKTWPETGIPANPYAWLVSTGRFRMIDQWRRRARLAAALPDMVRLADTQTEGIDPDEIRDDELRLIFTCCHPALPQNAQIALTLREVAGLSTEAIARAFLTPVPTIAQRIVRAKARIRDDRIPYLVPGRDELPARLETVLRVLYLIFNEGYLARENPEVDRDDLCAEAMRLTQLVSGLVSDPEADGLLALMLLHEARRATRVDADGAVVLLQDQDRTLWDQDLIAEARRIIDQAFSGGTAGSYLLQAAIVAVHATAACLETTDWQRIVSLYDALILAEPSPVVALNRAIALGMRDGARTGLVQVDAILAAGQLATYAPAYAARAVFLRELGRRGEALAAYGQALENTANPAERRHYEVMCAKLQ